ncbi:AMPK1_CBM domain-containing protein, partial [Psidium guajava]
LNPSEAIGSRGGRTFVLCKKQIQPQMTEARSEMISSKRSGSWKAWLNKSFNFKIPSH